VSCWRLRGRTIRCLLTDRTILCSRKDGSALIFKTYSTRKCKAHGSHSEVSAGTRGVPERDHRFQVVHTRQQTRTPSGKSRRCRKC
jgi:hypothetical protein